ncbi:MAG: NADPH-dependent 7-cyano-7-deazaguanine reductase QueF [Candidatus Margulisiibacteriota bacterium]|nr:MAG: NADPH-dependent 7-cyano-7-deazaguanine reductase QueF [Candidatus Margulisbacteria bacterium GWD2_39_127]OGI04120.1 MAG: NADPH-dependent 7-cyano-7-deazaguanine reductase QueF [Candidatus Margulisbacteria bacterium GWF2_38_17]OGI05971.1 MAG: NADPH-dependent 7-cyano-7-deazaguanine reductase QueF [Candidatus Margulisbacteria bacterium GWE2_39_32]PZM79573.1 MAG: NADPH-dependent 7-cyano-7-deazaguanine reductase QueF [Candidatus Margulisiibacteriota bacterium]HAR63375.1 NADPH-dependent 7-cyan
MVKAEGISFDFFGVEYIKSSFLEVFPYQGEKQYITYTTKEFSAVCPFSGLPDIAQVTIEYIPDEFCLELKSLKYYFISYRNVGIYQEAVTNMLFSDIYAVLKPHYLKVTTVYNTRGGIDATCYIEKGNK